MGLFSVVLVVEVLLVVELVLGVGLARDVEAVTGVELGVFVVLPALGVAAVKSTLAVLAGGDDFVSLAVVVCCDLIDT